MGEDAGPVALVTGGASGIGAAIVGRLLAGGHRVTATGRSAERLGRLAEATAAGDRLLTLPGDATDPEAVAEAVKMTEHAFGRLDHVVANAGYATHDTVASGDPERWRGMVLTNVLGPALLVNAALPALRRSRGRIVLMGSVAGSKNVAGSLYSATKAAVRVLAENTRMLVTRDGVGVTLVAPGRVDTSGWGDGGPGPGPLLAPEAVADCVAWVLAQPPGTDVNEVVVRPSGQKV
ncbi:SDR family oxidoreductase [Streptomyces mayteni]